MRASRGQSCSVRVAQLHGNVYDDRNHAARVTVILLEEPEPIVRYVTAGDAAVESAGLGRDSRVVSHRKV